MSESGQPRVSRTVHRAGLAVIIDGRVLLVRIRDREQWMLPGGRLEAGELPVEALAREIEEELGAAVDPESLDEIGSYDSVFPGGIYRQTIFLGRLLGEPAPRAEIEEVRWFGREDMLSLDTTHVFLEHAWPALRDYLG